MNQLRQRRRGIIRLDLLLDRPFCQPPCQGARTALPCLDDFLPFVNLKFSQEPWHPMGIV